MARVFVSACVFSFSMICLPLSRIHTRRIRYLRALCSKIILFFFAKGNDIDAQGCNCSLTARRKFFQISFLCIPSCRSPPAAASLALTAQGTDRRMHAPFSDAGPQKIPRPKRLALRRCKTLSTRYAARQDRPFSCAVRLCSDKFPIQRNEASHRFPVTFCTARNAVGFQKQIVEK